MLSAYITEQRLGLDAGTADRLFNFDPHNMAVVFADMMTVHMLQIYLPKIPLLVTQRIAPARKNSDDPIP